MIKNGILASVAVVNTLNKSNLGEKGVYCIQVTCHHKGKPVKELKAEEPRRFLLAHSQADTFLYVAFLHNQDYLHRDDAAHSGLRLPVLIVKTVSPRHDKGQYDLGNSSIRTFFSDDSTLCQIGR